VARQFLSDQEQIRKAACFPDSTHVTASTYTLVTPRCFLRKNRYFRTGYGGKKSNPEEDWNRLRSRLVLFFSPPEHQFHERIDSHKELILWSLKLKV
jgi:hypothetical protein